MAARQQYPDGGANFESLDQFASGFVERVQRRYLGDLAEADSDGLVVPASASVRSP